MSASVTQISVPSESGGTFFLKVDWVEDLGAGFTVALCDGESAWMGEVSGEEVQKEAQELEMRKESYVKEVQQALTGAGQVGIEYTFQLSSENAQRSTRRLTYEKVQRDISFRLGSVELLPCPEPDRVIKELISYGLQHSGELRAQNHDLLEQNQRLCSEHDQLRSELERYVQGKERLENELYSRFVLVLNAKKAKIHQLLERLRQLQEQQEKNSSSGVTTAETTAPEEADTSASAEEETPHIDLSQVSTVLVSDMTSQSSMDVDLSDITDVAPNRKRRCRHLHDPGPEVATGSRDQQRSGRKDPALESAHVATPCPETDSLFEDF